MGHRDMENPENRGLNMEPEEYLERLCCFTATTQIWFILYKGGGAYRFTEILNETHISRSALSNILPRLLALDLIRVVDGKYQAIIPGFLIHGLV